MRQAAVAGPLKSRRKSDADGLSELAAGPGHPPGCGTMKEAHA